MEQTLYTTPQAAKETGIPEGTIRSWLSRYPGLFVSDVHIIIEESGRKMWTREGIELLRSRSDSEGISRSSETENATETDATFNASSEILEPLLDEASTQLALEFFRQLPTRTATRIRAMINSPTPEERVLVSESMKGAIATGVTYLLPQNSETRRLAG
ncbi:MAG: hypothetical protein ACIWVG_29510 [Gloeotrichia echinulata HAB0833]